MLTFLITTVLLLISTIDVFGQTLIIIYGQKRTFDLTCPDIWQHVIQPNLLNAYLVLSLDEKPPFELSQVAGSCLRPMLNRTAIIDGLVSVPNGVHCHIKELKLLARAFNYANKLNITFEYAIKVRFDNAINRPILPIASIYRPHLHSQANEFHSFHTHLDTIYQQKYQRWPALTERVWAWIMTSGNPVFIEPSLFHPETVYSWTPFRHDIWTRRITTFVFHQQYGNYTASISNFNSVYSHQLVVSTRHAMRHLHPVYMIGSTWIHYGPYDLVESATQKALLDYGKASWVDFGINTTFSKDPRSVVESVIRLAHWKSKLNLVDLVYWPDYDISFSRTESRSYEEMRRDDTLFYWLVRDCEYRPVQKDCLINTQSVRITINETIAKKKKRKRGWFT